MIHKNFEIFAIKNFGLYGGIITIITIDSLLCKNQALIYVTDQQKPSMFAYFTYHHTNECKIQVVASNLNYFAIKCSWII